MGKLNRTRKLRMKIGKSYVSSFNKRRLAIGFIVLVLLFSALVFRMAYWQVVRAEDLHKRAAAMQSVDAEINPLRGNIYDSNRKLLAQTVTEYQLYGYTVNLYKSKDLSKAEKKRNIKELSSITKIPEKKMLKIIKGDNNLLMLADGLTQEQISRAEKTFGSNVVIKTKVGRSYPNKNFASQLLGSVNMDNVGRTGLEYQYNSELTGVKGRVVKTTDSRGNTLSNGHTRYYKAEDGNNLITTIDEVIQHYVESTIAKGMANTGAESITCIVMNPKTGDVIAMAHTPGFDPNKANEPDNKVEKALFDKMSSEERNEYLSKMWTNPAISGVYEPGSTFKLITASAAIDCGSTNSKSRYKCNGSINVNGQVLNCWYPAGHGVQDIKHAVGNSCNPALAKVALDMGYDRFYHYINLYGLTGKTHIDLPAEARPLVRNKDNVANVELATIGYGHGVAITPIELLTAVNALGNDGWLMKPKVLKEIDDSKGNKIRTIKDLRVRQVVSKRTADKMRDIMEYYVSSAGGTTAYVPGYRIGGKTGTANIVENGGYTTQTVASFVAMAPMDDPAVSMLVLVNKPSKSQFGASNAGPIVKELMEKILTYKGVERKYTVKEKAGLSGKEIEVPDITGISSRAAIAKLKALGFKYRVTPKGDEENTFNVIDQYPKAGTKLVSGGTVYLYKE